MSIKKIFSGLFLVVFISSANADYYLNLTNLANSTGQSALTSALNGSVYTGVVSSNGTSLGTLVTGATGTNLITNTGSVVNLSGLNLSNIGGVNLSSLLSLSGGSTWLTQLTSTMSSISSLLSSIQNVIYTLQNISSVFSGNTSSTGTSSNNFLTSLLGTNSLTGGLTTSTGSSTSTGSITSGTGTCSGTTCTTASGTKITTYGYEQPGDQYYDTNSGNGIGINDWSLTPGDFAVSPDIEAQFKSVGINEGDAVKVYTSDGKYFVGNWKDRTSSSLTGRIDIYTPSGASNSPVADGSSVVGFEKM